MVSPASVPGIHQFGTHANRPLATAVAAGAEYACTTHKLIYQSDGTNWATSFSPATAAGAIEFTIDGGGSAILTGVKGDIEIPFACTITAVRLFSDVSGSIVIDLWKDTYANFPPTAADTITASAKPTLSSATKSENTTLTGWTTALAAGDVLRVNVDSATTVTRVTVSISILGA